MSLSVKNGLGDTVLFSAQFANQDFCMRYSLSYVFVSVRSNTQPSEAPTIMLSTVPCITCILSLPIASPKTLSCSGLLWCQPAAMAWHMNPLRVNPSVSCRFLSSCAANLSPLVGNPPSASGCSSHALLNKRVLMSLSWMSIERGRLKWSILVPSNYEKTTPTTCWCEISDSPWIPVQVTVVSTQSRSNCLGTHHCIY